jgi:hypothetical protein
MANVPYDYTRTIDTLFSVATDTVSGDPVNLINQGGEKLLPELAAKGRIFMVNDAKQVSHPVLHQDGGGAIVDYLPGVITGSTAGQSLDNVAKEILTHAKFDMIASSRNISFPQDMPAGNQLDYMVNLVKSSGIGIFQREEALLVTGSADAASVNSFAPMDGDTNFASSAATRRPMSLLGLVAAGTEKSGETDSPGIDRSPQTFAGIEIDEFAHWAPQYIQTSGYSSDANTISAAEFEADIQKAILQCTFSGVESPDTILVGTVLYEGLLSAFRGRLGPMHLMENSVYGDEHFMIGGCKVIRHRMLDLADANYDLSGGNSAGCLGIYLLNMKSLRMNIVKQDMSIGEGFGFLTSPIEGVYPHPEKTNLFKRVGWKRCYSLDNGRRSFGFIDGVTGMD